MKKKTRKVRFDLITVLPEAIGGYFEQSVLGRAAKKGIIKFKAHDLRDFTSDRHGKVDDVPFGGGPGMVLTFLPIARAVRYVLGQSRTKKPKKIELPKKDNKSRVILFSTRGKKFDAKEAKRLSKYEQLVMIAGRYEGVDERVARELADEEISVGDYILTGGELAAAAVADAVARFIPGVLGKEESREEEKGSYPVYTRPEKISVWDKKKRENKEFLVPAVLLSGNHQKIADWRKEKKGQK